MFYSLSWGGGRRSEEIPAAELRRLYCEAGLSLAQVAAELGWSCSAVYSRLVALGIARRAAGAQNPVTGLDAAELRRLYLDDGLSLSAIAARYGCSLTTIWRKLKAAGIEARPDGSSPRYERTDFSGDVAEKAYLIGFRLGDLHVAMEGTRTIVVKCTSTRREQIDLFRELFEPYGHVYTDEATLAQRQRQSIGMEARLNMSFDFLLAKQDRVPDWILATDRTFFAFLGGYIDAEGYFRTYLHNRDRQILACLELRSYDATLLGQLGEGLNARGITCPPACVRVLAGYTNRAGVRSNRPLWGLGVHRNASLAQLFAKLKPFVQHRRRRHDMLRAWSVVTERLTN